MNKPKAGWTSGHQSVLNMHTGLLAKWYVCASYRGLWLWHDLTPAVRDSFAIEVPISSTKTKWVSLVQGVIKDRVALGSVSMSSDYVRVLQDSLRQHTKALGKATVEEACLKLRALQKQFPEGKGFNSLAELVDAVMCFLAPKVGLPVLSTSLLSRELPNECWQAAMEEFSEHDLWIITSAGKRCAYGPDLVGVRVPRAVPFVTILRRLGYDLIGGLGQSNYESMVVASTQTAVVTSGQGLPAPWSTIAPQTFRPSALLLWLLGGTFDPVLVQMQEC